MPVDLGRNVAARAPLTQAPPPVAFSIVQILKSGGANGLSDLAENQVLVAGSARVIISFFMANRGSTSQKFRIALLKPGGTVPVEAADNDAQELIPETAVDGKDVFINTARILLPAGWALYWATDSADFLATFFMEASATGSVAS